MLYFRRVTIKGGVEASIRPGYVVTQTECQNIPKNPPQNLKNHKTCNSGTLNLGCPCVGVNCLLVFQK